jgi:hypothetical protein
VVWLGGGSGFLLDFIDLWFLCLVIINLMRTNVLS